MYLKNFTPADFDPNTGKRICPPKGTCRCGTVVYLYDSMDNECDRCGANFNSCGQEVTPMAECMDHDDY